MPKKPKPYLEQEVKKEVLVSTHKKCPVLHFTPETPLRPCQNRQKNCDYKTSKR